MTDHNERRADFSDVTGGSSSTAPGMRPAPAATSTYTVKSGDSLSRIAKRLWGDAKLWPRLFEANRNIIKDPDLIYPGQVLTVPDHGPDAKERR